MVHAAWLTWLAACLTMPMLVVRVGQCTVSDLTFLASGVLLALAVRRKPRASPAWPAAAFLAVLAAGLALYRSSDSGGTLLVAARLVYLWLVWRWQARALLFHPRLVRHTVLAYAAGASVSALAAIGQVGLGLTVLGTELTGNHQSRAAGLAGHVNDQGGQLAVAVAFTIALLITAVGRQRLPLLLLAATCTVGLVLCGSVTGMSSALLAVVFLLLRAHVRPSRLLQAGALAVAGLLVAGRLQSRLTGRGPLDRLRSATGGNGDVSTLEIRLRTLRFAWAAVQDSPIVGRGLDAASGGTYDGVTLTHNIVLLYWFQGGLPLALALLVTLVSALPYVLARSASDPSLQEAAAGGAVAARVYAQTAPVMYQRYFWLPLVLLLVMADSPSRAPSGAHAGTPSAFALPRPRPVSSPGRPVNVRTAAACTRQDVRR